jgi:hypothetical protein
MKHFTELVNDVKVFLAYTRNSYSSPNIIRMIKPRKIWAGRVAS